MDHPSQRTPDPAATGSGARTPRASGECVESHAQHTTGSTFGKSAGRLTRESILQATGNGYGIFARYLAAHYPGGRVEAGRNISNPFLTERQSTPSFNIYETGSGWRYKDFARPTDEGDCFDYTARLYGLDVRRDFPKVLRRIAEDCGLIAPAPLPPPVPPTFTLTPRPFTAADREYWERIGVSSELLTRYGVTSVASYTAHKQDGTPYTVRAGAGEPLFAYAYGSAAWKVYRPGAAKGKRFRFLGTKPPGTVWGLEQVPEVCPVLAITAGEKDALASIAGGVPAVTLNSESATLTPAMVAVLRARAGVVVSIYDLDDTGRVSAERLRRDDGIPAVELPAWLQERGGKDTADFFAMGGTAEQFRALVEATVARAEPLGTNTTATDPLFAIGAEDDEPEEEEADEGAALPLLPAEVYTALPPMLGRVVAVLERDPETEPHERDVFLTAALPVVAGALPNVETVGREGHEGVNLYTVIVAEAGSGKGAMRYGRDLGREIDRRLYDESVAERARWHQRCKDGEAEPEPSPVSFFVSGNSSARAIVDALAANPCGVMVESEIRTVSATLKQDWGSFADILLKSFHREAVSITRKKNERVRVEHPALSVCLSGTPEAVRELIPGVEDGLFSRIAFYRFGSVERWRSQQPRAEASELHTALMLAARSLDSLHATLSQRMVPLVVELTPHQWERHTGAFTRLFSLTDPVLSASVKRSGVIAVRIAAVLAVLRVWEAEGSRIREREEVTVSDTEAAAGVMLAASYLRHAVAIAASLPKRGGTRMHGRKQAFFDALPMGVFRTAAALEIAAQLGIQERRAKVYLRTFTDAGLLVNSGHGEYTNDAKQHNGTFDTISTFDTIDPLNPCAEATTSAERVESAQSVDSAEVLNAPVRSHRDRRPL